MPIMSSSQSFEATAATVANKVTAAGSAGSVVGWMSSSSFGMWAGIAIGLAGFLVNWYFKIQTNKRERREYEIRMSKWRIENPPSQMKGAYADE